MARYKVNDTSLTAVANAIREKAGTSEALEFPGGFVDAINDISSGGGNNRMELIEEITLTEDTSSIVRDVLPDGTPYGFKTIFAMIAQQQTWSNQWIKIVATYDKQLYGAKIYALDGGIRTGTTYDAYKALNLSGNKNLVVHAGVQEVNGIITNIFTYGGPNPAYHNNATASVGCEVAYNVNAAKITKFEIMAQTPLVATTRIFLFGVRA